MASSIPVKYQLLSKSIWSIDVTLTGTTILDQSGPRDNGNKGNSALSRTGASPSDTVLCHTQDFVSATVG